MVKCQIYYHILSLDSILKGITLILSLAEVDKLVNMPNILVRFYSFGKSRPILLQTLVAPTTDFATPMP